MNRRQFSAACFTTTRAPMAWAGGAYVFWQNKMSARAWAGRSGDWAAFPWEGVR